MSNARCYTILSSLRLISRPSCPVKIRLLSKGGMPLFTSIYLSARLHNCACRGGLCMSGNSILGWNRQGVLYPIDPSKPTLCSPECLDFIYSGPQITFFINHLIQSPSDSGTFPICTLPAVLTRMRYLASVDTILYQGTHEI